MRRAAATFVKAGAKARSFASATSVEPATSSGVLQKIYLGLQITAGLLFVGGSIGGAGYALHRVDAKLEAMSTKLDGAMLTVNAKVEGLEKSVTKEVNAKVEGLEKSVTKEVDAKVEGLEKSVTKEVDAKLAGVSDKAKAEALMILKEYGVSIAGGLASK